jgi:hypothetical protein
VENRDDNTFAMIGGDFTRRLSNLAGLIAVGSMFVQNYSLGPDSQPQSEVSPTQPHQPLSPSPDAEHAPCRSAAASTSFFTVPFGTVV